MPLCFRRNHFRNVQPRARRAWFNMGKRLVDSVVGADQEIGTDARELNGGSKHQLADSRQIAAFETIHIVCKRE